MPPWTAARPGPRTSLGAAALSAGGHVVHNLAEFPPAVLLAPETLFPVGLTALLAWAMVRRPTRRVFLVVILWAAVVLVLGGASVLPLPVWPFDPRRRSATTRPTSSTPRPSCRCCGSAGAGT